MNQVGLDETLAGSTRGRAVAPTGKLARGDAVGRYVIVEPLGEGGMGIVYSAFDAELDRKVALKLIHPRQCATGGSPGRDRLVREAQAMAKLDHPNVVTVFDVGSLGTQAYLAMELIDGETLTAWSKRTRPRWPAVLEVFLAAARGLAAAHRVDLVHRDFKPDNVMIGPGTRVRVMDFGLARSARDPVEITNDDETTEGSKLHRGALAERFTVTGSMLGTPAYMAPEQFALADVDAAADQFSFCVALWEAVYGQRPFSGATLAELSARVLGGKIDRPPRAPVPGWLRRVLERGLAVEPTSRWRSIDALLVALERGLARRRWVRVGGVLALGVAVFGGTRVAEAIERSAAHHRCGNESAAIDEVWNAGTRERLRALMTDASLPASAATFDRAAAAADGLVSSWTESYQQACDVAVDSPAATEWPRIADCFADRRDELSAVVEVLEGGVENGLQRFAPMIFGIDTPTQCLDPAWLERQPPRSDADDALRPKLWRAHALDTAGDIDATFALATEIAAEAEQAGLVEIVVRAQLLLASAEDDRGELEHARDRTLAAFDAALAKGNDEDAIECAAKLVHLEGVQLANDRVATLWARIGRDLVERAGAERSLASVMLHNAIAMSHRAHARYADAERELLLTLEIKRELLGSNHLRLAVSTDNLGLVYREQGRYDEALVAHQTALATREAALGPAHIDVATTLNNLGVVYEELGRYQESIAALERALAIRESVYGPQHHRVGPPLMNLAMSCERRGDHARAEAYLLRAKAIYEHPTPDVRQIALVYNNLGVVHRAAGEREQALAEFQRALDMRIGLYKPDHPLIAASYNNLGLVYGELDQLDLAESFYGKALAIYELHGSLELATAHANLGGIHYARGRLEDARRSFARSVAVVEQRTGADNVEVAFGLLGLARVGLETGDAALALRSAERALAVRETAGVDPAMIAEAQYVTAHARVASGESREAALALARRALATLDAGAGEGFPALRAALDSWITSGGTLPIE